MYRAPQDDEPSQTTPKGLAIPVPSREQIESGLKKIAKPIAKPSADDDSGPKK
jgi:hypothetical protein